MFILSCSQEKSSEPKIQASIDIKQEPQNFFRLAPVVASVEKEVETIDAYAAEEKIQRLLRKLEDMMNLYQGAYEAYLVVNEEVFIKRSEELGQLEKERRDLISVIQNAGHEVVEYEFPNEFPELFPYSWR